MELSTKYISGFGVLVAILILFSYIGTLDEIELITFLILAYFDSPPNPIPIFILGASISIIGVFFFLLLFSPERIKGFQLEYEAAPDLSTFKVVKRISGEPTNKELEIPSVAYCSACGNQIHNPFRCQRCGQLLCGKHYLHGDHQCKEEY